MLSRDLQDRAARFRPAEVRRRLRNPMVRPRWIGDDDRFWYPKETEAGVVFTEVDAATGDRRPAFDHAELAASLAAAAMRAVDAANLPLEDLRIASDGALTFTAFGRAWSWRHGDACKPGLACAGPGEVLSPDGRWAAYRNGHDLWLRETATGATRALTQDGAAHYAYAKSPDMNLTAVTLARRAIVLPAAVLWSPDSRRLFTCRLDERNVPVLPLVQHVPDDGSVRPVLHSHRVALSGDAEVPHAEPVVIDVETGALIRVDVASEIVFVMTTVERNEAWWSADGARVFHLARDRAQRNLTLWETDAGTGAARAVLTESEATFVDVNLSVTGMPNVRVLDRSNEVLWFSQRDGRAHLYLCDLATGALKNPITSGELIVRDLAYVDEAARTVLFLAGGLEPGEDPARRKLCRAGLDGSGVRVLTPEPGDHDLAMPQPRPPRDHVRPRLEAGWFLSPSGQYLVETYGTLDSAPVSVLRRIDGSVVATLETAELAPDLARDWRWPMPFHAKSADSDADLYGAIWLPTDFDPARQYPVIDYIYPGPQRGNLPTVSLPDTLAELARSCMPQSFAELGFAVVVVDGRGSALREKAFHDLSYGKLQNPGRLEDHVAVLQELAHRHPWFDTRRVGIMGHSGGGYASVHAMLTYPDVFHAAVATSGNHDQRGYSFAWCEKYQGPLVRDREASNYDEASNPPFAHRLEGKLLLATGDMDDNVHPALTLQLVDALIR
ncbi:MAG TPA: DPP IV N-terminal domain-containing protein, partial [Acetobacteraceae bacterium]|nr:DPP IV N-terminal domain-containing protein [Acetobacteraceae bacterium]